MGTWLRPKAEVEVRSDDEGFRGVWYEAVLLCLRRRRRCDVQYTTLLSDLDPSKPLRESVRLTHLRPRPPASLKSGVYGVHDLVEVFHSDGWWCGVVSSVLDGGERYRVSFPTSREEIVVGDVSMIRPKLDWDLGQWKSLQGQEAKHPVYTVSAIVQVSRERASFGISWFAAQIKKVISNNIFLVEYRNIKVDGSDNELLTEIIDIQYIRPLQMLDSSVDFMVEDEVEVLLDGGWCSGVVVQILEGSNYRIKLDHSQEEKEFNKSIIRGGCQWDGFEWVPASKLKSKKSGSRVKFTEKEQGPFMHRNAFAPLSILASSDESGATCESNSSISKGKKVEGPSPRAASEGPSPRAASELKSSLSKRKKVEEPSPMEQIVSLNSRSLKVAKLVEVNERSTDSVSQGGCSAGILKGNEIKSCQTSKRPRKTKSLKNGKSPPDNMLSDGGSSELFDTHQLRNCNSAPEAPLLGELVQVDGGDSSVHLCEDSRTKNLTPNSLEDERNSKGGYIPSSNSKTRRKQITVRRPQVKALANEHNATMIMNGSSEGHVNGHKNSAESTTVIDDCEDDRELDVPLNKICKATPVIQHNEESGHEGPKVITNTKELPFSKESTLWEAIESMEVFRNIPQEPHFQPLKQYAAEFREGMAIGLMISFANLVSSVQKLQVDEAQATIREKFEALVPLKKNGFNVQFLQLRLQKLLEFQTCQGEYKSKKSSMNEKLLRKKEETAKLDASIMAVDKSILEIEEKLKQIYEERDSLYSQRKKNESEICKIQEDLFKVEEDYNSAERRLGSSLAAL